MICVVLPGRHPHRIEQFNGRLMVPYPGVFLRLTACAAVTTRDFFSLANRPGVAPYLLTAAVGKEAPFFVGFFGGGLVVVLLEVFFLSLQTTKYQNQNYQIPTNPNAQKFKRGDK